MVTRTNFLTSISPRNTGKGEKSILRWSLSSLQIRLWKRCLTQQRGTAHLPQPPDPQILTNFGHLQKAFVDPHKSTFKYVPTYLILWLRYSCCNVAQLVNLYSFPHFSVFNKSVFSLVLLPRTQAEDSTLYL